MSAKNAQTRSACICTHTQSSMQASHSVSSKAFLRLTTQLKQPGASSGCIPRHETHRRHSIPSWNSSRVQQQHENAHFNVASLCQSIRQRTTNRTPFCPWRSRTCKLPCAPSRNTRVHAIVGVCVAWHPVKSISFIFCLDYSSGVNGLSGCGADGRSSDPKPGAAR